MKKTVEVLRKFSIRQRLFVFILLPLILIIFCFLLYYSFSRQVLFEKNEQVSRQRIAMAEKSLSLNAMHLQERFQNICKQDFWENALDDREAKGILDQLSAHTVVIYNQNDEIVASYGDDVIIDSTTLSTTSNGWFYDEKTGSIGLRNELIAGDKVTGYACALFYQNDFAPVMMVFDGDKQGNLSNHSLTMAHNAAQVKEGIESFIQTLFWEHGLKEEEIKQKLTELSVKSIVLCNQAQQSKTIYGEAIIFDPAHATIYEDGWFYDHKNEVTGCRIPVYEGALITGYAYAVFSEDMFTPVLKSTADHTVLLITDERYQVLFGHGPLENGTQLTIEDGTVSLGFTTYYVQESEIDRTGWKILDLTNEDYIYEEINNIRNMLLLYCVICLLILFFFSSLFYHSIYDPINKILNSMNDFNEEDMESILVIDQGKDEIHDLNETFNNLVIRIEELLHTVNAEQEQRRETQFQLLQAQINPHFLFNTLNTLRYLALLNEDKPVSEGIGALAKLLRNTIVEKNELVTIQEEIENVRSYIIIQKLRYGDIFETVYNIDENVKYRRILKFLLQPIVENSILHAFEEDREHQILTIRVRSMQGFLKIEIGDNGKGFYPKEENSNKKLSGIGMQNIQDRISLMYGGKYRMEVKSVVDAGTITTLYLPLQ